MLNIIEHQPLFFKLWGFSADVPDERFGATGFRLMNEMWRLLKANKVRSEGTNHWVYLDRGRMFVGVALLRGESAPTNFENLEFQLDRYVEHLHVGPYQLLPAVWQTLMAELKSGDETIAGPSLEIYGHQSPEATKPPETTIVIGLRPN